MREVTEQDYMLGSTFQSGEDDNEIVLVLESPGAEELAMQSPLSGPAFLNYECLRTVMFQAGKPSFAMAMEKHQVRILNVWPEQLNESDRDKIIMEVEKGRRDKMLDIIASKIGNKKIVICVGHLACLSYSALMKRELSHAQTIVYIPYFGDRGLINLLIPTQNERRSNVILKLEFIGVCLANFLPKDGRFGWCEMRRVWKENMHEENVLWHGSKDGPRWMRP